MVQREKKKIQKSKKTQKKNFFSGEITEMCGKGIIPLPERSPQFRQKKLIIMD